MNSFSSIGEGTKRLIEEMTKQNSLYSIGEGTKRFVEEMTRQNSLYSIGEDTKRLIEEMTKQNSLYSIGEDTKRLIEEMTKQNSLYSIGEESKRNLAQIYERLDQQGLFRLYSSIVDRCFEIPVKTLVNAIHEDELADFHIASDGSVALGSDTATSMEVQEAFAELLNQPEKFLPDVSEYLAKLKKPVRVILSWFLQNIIGIVSLLLTLQLQFANDLQIRDFQRQLLEDGDVTRKEIRDAVRDMAKYQRDLSKMRIVINAVDVKAQRLANARNIDRLASGTLVTFVEKQSRWVLVEYESPKTGSIARGWVYSKHLKRIE